MVGRAAKAYHERIPGPFMNALESFHPAVAAWFTRTFDAPTQAQAQAWPAIRSGRHVLVAAPTGSGKTFAAFLAAIDELVKEGVSGELPDETRVVYVSPLKALSNDIHRNLEAPIQGIRAELAALNLPDVAISTVVRTGDTPADRTRANEAKCPPYRGDHTGIAVHPARPRRAGGTCCRRAGA